MKILTKKLLSVLLVISIIALSGMCAINSYALTDAENIKFGVMSDLHFHSVETGVDTNLEIMLNYYKEQNVDAVLVTGDVADGALPEQYAKFNAIWDKVFTENAPQKLVIMGNHEFGKAYYHEETIEDAYNNYLNAYGYSEINFNKAVNGYHFIGINSESASVDGKYTSTTLDWLKTQIDNAVAENATAPIFVACHQPLPETTYGSTQGTSGTAALKALLKDYPNVVYFSGHSHRPIENEKCIWQGDFTAIDCTSLQYVSLEPDFNPNDAYEAQGALLVSVDTETNKMTVERKRIDKTNNSVKDAKTSFVLNLPLQKSTFNYTDDRIDLRTAPVFAEDSEISVSEVSGTSATITFPSASHGDYVQGYKISFINNNTNVADYSETYVSDFYIDYTNMKPIQTVTANGLSPHTAYTVQAIAYDSFGLESTPISTTLETLDGNEIYSYYYEPYSYHTWADFSTLFNETEGVTFDSINMETGYNVLGDVTHFGVQRISGDEEGVLQYDFKDKYVTEFSANVILYDSFVNNYSADYIVSLSALQEASSEYIDVDTDFSSRTVFEENNKYSLATIVNLEPLPEKTVSVKLFVAPKTPKGFKAGGVGYTIMLDDISMTLLNANLIVDEIDNLDMMSSYSNITKTFTYTDDGKTHYIAMKENHDGQGIITYDIPNGKQAKSFSLDFLYLPAFFSKLKDIVSALAVINGSEVPLDISFVDKGLVAEDDNPNYNRNKVCVYCDEIPDMATKIILILDPFEKNYINYTAYLDTAYIFTENFPGDVNGDGVISIIDLVAIKKYLASNEYQIYFDNADLDNSGNITADDVTYLIGLLLK